MAHVHSHIEPTHDNVHHEESDIDIRAVVMTGVGLVAITAFSYLVVWLLFGFLSRQADHASTTRAYPLAEGQENRLPPEPRLQTTPRQDLLDLRAEEADILSHYSWVDRNSGVVRIPIEQAMKLTLQRGLPARGTREARQP